MTYLISPSQVIGNLWARQLKLSKREYRVISKIEQSYGLRFINDKVIFLMGKEFDYPEYTLEAIGVYSKFIDMVDEVKFKMNLRNN